MYYVACSRDYGGSYDRGVGWESGDPFIWKRSTVLWSYQISLLVVSYILLEVVSSTRTKLFHGPSNGTVASPGLGDRTGLPPDDWSWISDLI